jgi:hypothetical protein
VAQPTTTTSAPAATGAGPGAPTIVDTVTQYYALANQDALDEAYTWLSEDYQRQTGRARYDSFWGGIESVTVSDVQPQGQDSATATLLYVRTDGTPSQERVRVDFVRDEATGNYLIDGYTVVGGGGGRGGGGDDDGDD